ncbi:MAG: sel1 repeat family protein [Gammaproteobacteria bacterium]|nr:sel1 repeat family protein [Gammaproteobacteria bacterium]
MVKNSINIIKLCCIIFFIGAIMPATANEYNEGFLAAESGNYDTAISKWGPLASSGHPIAQFNIALMYHGGLGVAANEAEAVRWYKMSANNGYYAAQEYLSAAYKEGWFGLPRNQILAKFWEEKAENQN